jgi:hypothetical protein
VEEAEEKEEKEEKTLLRYHTVWQVLVLGLLGH